MITKYRNEEDHI